MAGQEAGERESRPHAGRQRAVGRRLSWRATCQPPCTLHCSPRRLPPVLARQRPWRASSRSTGRTCIARRRRCARLVRLPVGLQPRAGARHELRSTMQGPLKAARPPAARRPPRPLQPQSTTAAAAHSRSGARTPLPCFHRKPRCLRASPSRCCCGFRSWRSRSLKCRAAGEGFGARARAGSAAFVSASAP